MIPDTSDFLDQFSDEELARMDYMKKWHVQAEYGVLAVILLNNDAFDRVASFLRPEHFSTSIGQKVYKSVSKALSKGERCDAITIYADLERTDPNNDVTLMELNEIAQHGAAASMLMKYADAIVEKARERDLLQAINIAYEVGSDQTLRVEERTAKIAALLDKTSEQNTAGREPVRIGDLIPQYLDKLNRYADGAEIAAIPTGMEKLDDLLGGGLKDGKVYVVAARPSVGKSALAQAICESASRQGKPAAMFSQEMMNEEMVDRAISRIGGVSMGFHNRPINDANEDFTRALEAAEIATGMPFFMFDGAGLRLQEIASRARTLKRKHGLSLLAIDYLQLCQSVNPRLSRHHQIEEISRGIKTLAKELSIPILLLSQLNREVEKRNPPRPITADLKESGAIEEDADVIILMWPHEKGDSHVLTGFDVAKNRGGRKGEFAMRFVGKYQQWHDTDEPLREMKKIAAGSSYEF